MITLKELLEAMDGKENVELWADGERYMATATGIYVKKQFNHRYIGEIRLNPEIYLGITIYLRDE